jgi:hypothetical protein
MQKEPDSRYLRLSDDAFTERLSLSDAYRLMEQFVKDYHGRGDTPVSDFLDGYSGVCADGVTSDPAALPDFLKAWEQIKRRTDGKA